MITGFEDLTYELTDIEKEIIYPKFVETWSKKPYDKLITMRSMMEGMQVWISKAQIKTKKNKEYKLTGPRMRKIIHEARVKGDLKDVVANSRGYFRTTDKEKILLFIKSCKQKANSFTEVAYAMEAHWNNKN